ncbi:glycine betaine ABC transporter substrate-binding protein [Paenibacillus radicis (ex Xue et al. 2023)]|uniref:Glycine/betaine ABC transporter substrate-binding protein n=1 Tax=Paenibacillus radicis (ex Xue et al. 2023) TaxID=2972489 RepID=A0ABT1YHN0_9BACL|nr:glycine betaine ABC transporter substrate-binding protein [Paenibacillus radicis (ex Xue et al. 2023)]MCR8632472.1 glycine/betaine ABC transporter substrate-binding protein [Paenibacillus radicis (ex Xue et al. 2023)]
MKNKWIIPLALMIVLMLASMLIANPFGLGTYKESDRAEEQSPESKPVITIGSKSFTEQYLLMKMTGILLRENGFNVKEIIFKGSTNIRSALEAGVIDQYWEYANTARIYYQHQAGIEDANEAFRIVSEEDKKIGLHWLPITTEINSTWAVLIKKELAEQYGINTISDLGTYAKEHKRLNIATNSEFLIRADGLKQFESVYDLDIPRENVIVSDTKLFAQAVKESRVQATIGFSSDGRIDAYGLVELEDDRHFFPPYNPAPVVKDPVLKQNPRIEPLLTGLTNQLDHDKFKAYLYKADVLHEDVTELARQYLLDTGLIRQKK